MPMPYPASAQKMAFAIVEAVSEPVRLLASM